MLCYNRVVNGMCALALIVSFVMASVAPAYADTDLERYDAMNLTPMPDAFADELRGEGLISMTLGAALNYGAKKLGSKVRFTLFSPLKACAPTKDKPDC